MKETYETHEATAAAEAAAQSREEAAASASAEGVPAQGAKASPLAGLKHIDGGLLLKLLKNPLHGLSFGGDKLLYGWVGLASSLLGFLIWSLLVQRLIETLLYGLLGPFSLLSSRRASGLETGIAWKLLLLGAVSLAALLAALWLIGSWRGASRSGWKDWIAKAGSMQLFSGAGFAIAGVVLLIHVPLSMLLFGVTLISSLTLAMLGGAETFAVPAERRFTFIALTAAVYMVLVSIITAAMF